MSKLTKAQIKAHQEACRLLEQEVLSEDDRWFVLENWREDATHINSARGAFFTPIELARSFSIEVHGRRVIDLCAGIGTLSFLYAQKCCFGDAPEITCVDINPDYAAVGRKILPQATWVVGSIFDIPELGHFDCAISNPPFGAIDRAGANAPRFKGRQFEYHVIDMASDIANYGAFIIPQMSAPFRYSGEPSYSANETELYLSFAEKTGIVLGANCGIDCSASQHDWHGVAPKVEIVTVDFVEARARRTVAARSTAVTQATMGQGDLFGFREAAE